MTESDPERANLTPAPKGDKPVRVLEDLLRLSPSGSLLGLDPGTRTIGVATSDTTRLITTPLETIRRTKWSRDAERLQAIAEERTITGIVLGYPLNMDDSEGPRAQAARQMGNNLIRALGLPVLLWDERLSSFEAETMMQERGLTKKQQAPKVDSMAAAIILQNVLDLARQGG